MTTLNQTFFGFAIADSMFASDCIIQRKVLSVDEAKDIINDGVLPCLNPSHEATIKAMNVRFDIHVAIPEKAPIVSLNAGDRLLVMGVRGLPRLDATRHEYTEDEIAGATFVFSLYTVQDSNQN